MRKILSMIIVASAGLITPNVSKADVFADEVHMTAESLSLSNPLDHGQYMARVAIINSQKSGQFKLGRAQWALRQDSYQFGHPDAWYATALQKFSEDITRWQKNGEMPQ
jgi:hypothetical protein